MRVNLTTRRTAQCESALGTTPISVTIRPACMLPGNYDYLTNCAALLDLLRRQTDLPDYVLRNFEISLRTPLGGQLKGVELSDSVLSEIGYFID